MPEGDPNLPPTGKGWIGVRGNYNDLINFGPSPKLELKLREMESTLEYKHFPLCQKIRQSTPKHT